MKSKKLFFDNKKDESFEFKLRSFLLVLHIRLKKFLIIQQVTENTILIINIQQTLDKLNFYKLTNWKKFRFPFKEASKIRKI